jgi:hypothetical protein
MTQIPKQVNLDLDQILREAVIEAANPMDELTLLRAAIRRYLQTGDAHEAVPWAADNIARSISGSF